jgi:hypothetical protein
MAKASIARAPVTARGIELLNLIASSQNGYLMLTQDEGAEAVAAGFATVDANLVQGDMAAVSLTAAGKAQIAPEPVPVVPVATFAIDEAIPLPATTGRRSREGGYPFDKLEVGQSFHVAATADNADPVLRLQSSVSAAKARYAVETGETEIVTVKEYLRDGKGYVKDENGKRVVVATTSETRPVMKATRNFTVKAVDASDPRGAGARVWRTA